MPAALSNVRVGVNYGRNVSRERVDRYSQNRRPAPLIADKIVGGCGLAEFRPALHAPLIDVTGLAHQSFEALRLAQYGVRVAPKEGTEDAMAIWPGGMRPKISKNQTRVERPFWVKNPRIGPKRRVAESSDRGTKVSNPLRQPCYSNTPIKARRGSNARGENIPSLHVPSKWLDRSAIWENVGLQEEGVHASGVKR